MAQIHWKVYLSFWVTIIGTLHFPLICIDQITNGYKISGSDSLESVSKFIGNYYGYLAFSAYLHRPNDQWLQRGLKNRKANPEGFGLAM